MAILATVELVTGEERELYLRVNNAEISNHGQKGTALIRGFISEQAFLDSKHYAHEETIEFDSDVSGLLWEQAYNQLKTIYPDYQDA